MQHTPLQRLYIHFFFIMKQIVHRDLAARNVLVREDKRTVSHLLAKISDLGLSRKAVMDGTYQAQATVRMLALFIY